MHFRPLVGLALVTALFFPGLLSAQTPLVAETDPLSPAEQQTKFHLPPGFVIELVASEPEIQKPMNLKFDAAGRLFVTQSIEYPFPVGEGVTGRDTIRVMIDTNSDGLPDKTEVYADGLNIPIGVTPVPGGVLGYAIPELSFFPDTNHDLKADSRQPMYAAWGFRDTHGMCSSLNYWIDGWVYGCHGFANESSVSGADRQPLQMQSGNTYRLRPDGSHIEAYTRGQVNPFGMCFDAFGNVYTSDCHTRPAYLLVRGAYYPSFGKPHDGLGFGPEMMQHAHGSTGIAGVVVYDADQFGSDYHGNLFLGNPVTGRINRDRLDWKGSTPIAIEQPDFLWCDDPWFRPVDLQLGPDGSLYIADFYNRIIGHYEVPLTHPGRDRERGRIWRIRYTGTPEAPALGTPAPATLETADIGALIAALDHPNLTVRVQATHQLVQRESAGQQLADRKELTERQLAHAIYVWARQESPERAIGLAQSESPLVRVHLQKMLGDLPAEQFAKFASVVRNGLKDNDPRVRRAAAEAAGKQPQPGWEVDLLTLWKNTDPVDALLVHTTRIALRDHLAKFQDFKVDPSPAGLQSLADVSLGIPAEPAARFLDQFVATPPDWFVARIDEYARHLARYSNDSRLPPLMESLQSHDSWPLERKITALRAVDRGLQERGVSRPAALTDWATKLAGNAFDAGQIIPALELTRDFGLQQYRDAVLAIADDSGRDDGLRKLAFETLAVVALDAAIRTGGSWLSPPLASADLQQHAANVLGQRDREDVRTALLERLQAAPAATAVMIARGLVQTPAGSAALLSAIEAGKATPRLLQDGPIEQRMRGAILAEFDSRRSKLLEGLPAVDERVTQLIAARRAAVAASKPDFVRGQALFKQHCAACHKLGDVGNKVGPELHGVGLRGLDRLLEDTLDPSRLVDQAFRTTVINTADGKVITGLLLRQEGAVVVLADEQGREVRVSEGDIDERAILPLSPMPANIAEKLSEADYANLLGFLLEQRQPVKN